MICESCQSAVARSDVRVEDLGKVAPLCEIPSSLKLGMRVTINDRLWEVMGRTQYQHQAGGYWNEWYLVADDGRTGWLAEAQGRQYFTFPQRKTPNVTWPSFEKLQLNQRVQVSITVSLVVAEIGSAKTISAEGELPQPIRPGAEHRYADLSGSHGRFGTLDYQHDEPRLFLGKLLTPQDLVIESSPDSETTESEPAPVKTIEALLLSCPSCGGALELRAPDQSERVACPYCGALSDVDHGNLKFLKALNPPTVRPQLALGARGTLGGIEYTILGMLQRRVVVDGTSYYWQEYLMIAPQVGFRWLVQTERHWSFVEPINPGDVRVAAETATYKGRSFALFQSDDAEVTSVQGEFYWKVELGETARVYDYISPPEMLSRETTMVYARADSPRPNSQVRGETAWSHGTYLPVEEVEKSFRCRNLPRPTKIGVNQPFPLQNVTGTGLIFAGLALFVWLVLSFAVQPQAIASRNLQIPTPADSAHNTTLIAMEHLQLQSHRNVCVTVTISDPSNWAYCRGTLYHESTGAVHTFAVPVGSQTDFPDGTGEVYLSALPAGPYSMRTDIQWSPSALTPPAMTIDVKQGVVRGIYLVWIMGLLSIVPIGVFLYQMVFHSARWSESSIKYHA